MPSTLQVAGKRQNQDILGALLKSFASPLRTGPTTLVYEDDSVIAFPDLRGADVDPREVWDETPLMFAARGESVEVVEALLDAGADLDAHDKDGATPLNHAARSGSQEVLQALLDAGADLEPHDVWDETPLMVAAGNGSPEMVEALIDAGADLGAASHHQQSTGAYSCGGSANSRRMSVWVMTGGRGAPPRSPVAISRRLRYRKSRRAGP